MRTTLTLIGLLAACSDAEWSPHDPRLRPVAADVDLGRIVFLQAHEIPLYLSPNQTHEGVVTPDVVIGRDSVLRVQLEASPAYEERELSAVLVVRTADEEHLFEETLRLPPVGSQQDDLSTSFQFPLPGELVSNEHTYEVSIHEAPFSFRPGGDPSRVSWSSEDMPFLARTTDLLRVVLVPIAYQYDGSGRVPLLDQARVDVIRDAIAASWPAADVSVTVADPIAWEGELTGNGAWTGLLTELQARRAAAPVAPNTYFYGMFQPTETFDAFCGGGCTLGLAPGAIVSDPGTRASIGASYDVLDPQDHTIGTLLHEVGHNHGRFHAPCGTGGDGGYPYPDAEIGAWGYDAVHRDMIGPTERVDMMSYCDPIWLSDYTYQHMGTHLINVRGPVGARGAAGRYAAYAIDGDEVEVLGRDVTRWIPADGPRRRVELLDGDGRSLGEADVAVTTFDHVDTVVVHVPERADLADVRLRDR